MAEMSVVMGRNHLYALPGRGRLQGFENLSIYSFAGTNKMQAHGIWIVSFHHWHKLIHHIALNLHLIRELAIGNHNNVDAFFLLVISYRCSQSFCDHSATARLVVR